ncbi:MAG: ATP-binding protein [Myxococcota bacterium]|nr:ATP-binding protein [Myxococcota bacterium]
MARSEARLGIAEVLLASVDAVESATEVLEWLASQTSIERGLVAIVDPDSLQCQMVASFGGAAGGTLNVALDRQGDPLLPIFLAPGAMRIDPATPGLRTPIGTKDLHGIALRPRSGEQELPAGLLLLQHPDDELPEDAVWVARLLAEKIASLRTRRAASESRHLRERQLLLAILNAVADPIVLTDPEGRLLVANARAERLFASRDEESEGRRRAVSMNNMLFSAALSSMGFAEESSETRSELLLVDPTEGSDLLFELMAHVVKDLGEGTCVVSILRNVTDLGRAAMEIELADKKLRIAEAEMRAERHRLDLIIDSVADPIIVTDPAGEFLLLNEPAERIFSVSDDAPDEAIRWVRGNEAHFSSFVSNLLFGGHEQRRHKGELGLVSPSSGESLPVEAVAGKVLSEKGELNAVVTILHDRREALERARLYRQLEAAAGDLEQKVTEATAELAHQNELLRRQALEVERASAAKSQFLANMSHELRTPLNAMLGYTSMLLQGVSGELAPAQKQKAQRIEANGKNLLAIINEILDITRIESGRMPLHVADFDAGEVVHEVVTELEAIISRSKLLVNVEVPPRRTILRSDRQKVKQIVLNLLGNALKFTREGEVRLQVTATRAGIVMNVTDTGIGIGDEDQHRIFEDFQQVDSSPTRRYGGTGLGLAICRRLARMLQGEITLSSRVGEGSTFTLTLPRRARER